MRGSVVERRPDKTKVPGSIPGAPTRMEAMASRRGRSLRPQASLSISARPQANHSETGGSNCRHRRLKNAKILKEQSKNFKGATGGLNKKLLSVVRLPHQKSNFQLLRPKTIYQNCTPETRGVLKRF